MFFIISGLLIISNNNLALSEKENLDQFLEFYRGWVNQIYFNSQTITGEAVKLDWAPDLD